MTTPICRLILLLIVCLTFGSVKGNYPPLQDFNGDTSQWGKHIQRTMGLLAESRPDQRNPVKILFYGQSIIGGQWHAWVERDLRERFPHADLTVENRALGGYSSQFLVKMVEKDLLASQPDLVIFHVLGSQVQYEEIIHTIRQRSGAEVMIMTSHWPRDAYQPDGTYKMDDWAAFFDEFLPVVAAHYDCELVQVRWPWKEYLQENKLEPGVMLTDNIHLNEHGLWLMAELAKRQLLYRPELITDVSRNLVRTYTVGEENADLQWKDGELTLEFTGNRVEGLTGAGAAAIEVFIDGKRPSELPSTTLHSRTSSIARPQIWPDINRITFNAIPPPQLWTMTIDSVDFETQSVTFSLEGSVTGPDGSGSSAEPFVSDSGQVVIEPEDWCLPRKMQTWDHRDAAPGMQIRWSSYTLAEDVILPEVLLERNRPVVQTIIDGLPNKQHALTLKTNGQIPPLYLLRVYSGSVPDGPFIDLKINPGDARLDLSRMSDPTPED